MKILKLCGENYRNLEKFDIAFGDGVNFIYGENAQGKTNLIESIWMLTGARSFRGTKDKNLINFEKDYAKIESKVLMSGREQNIKICFSGEKRKAFLNDVPKRYATEIIGNFRAVIFSPLHLAIISGGGEKRRKFIDAAICQLRPMYTAMLIRYNHILRQRNSLLKNFKSTYGFSDVLDVLDDSLVKVGAKIISYRADYINNFFDEAVNIYSEISGGKENLKFRYLSGVSRDILSTDFQKNVENLKDLFLNKLQKSRDSDLKSGFTSVGPHKDDLSMQIDLKNVKEFASQGQRRSVALSMKLAEATILDKLLDDSPIILLDDVMSELDDIRKKYMVGKIKNWQVFITGCEKSDIDIFKSDSVYLVDGGKINNYPKKIF